MLVHHKLIGDRQMRRGPAHNLAEIFLEWRLHPPFDIIPAAKSTPKLHASTNRVTQVVQQEY